jgi:uncharacterized membrane protein (DUF2068 family)
VFFLSPMSSNEKEPALRAIIGYKLVRSVTALGASGTLAVLIVSRRTEALRSMAEALRQHATSAWSVALARALVSAIAPHHVWLVVAALALDGSFTAIEAWALRSAPRWGPWLVVASTCVFVPFEVVALVRHPHVGRAVILLFNVAIVLYLVRRAVLKREPP